MNDEQFTVLLVEDDPHISSFLAENLCEDGYEVFVADCIKDGLRLIEAKYPDIVLLDVRLPDGSGLELIRRVREADGIATRIDPELPIVVVSGNDGELARLRGFENGCDDYVVKPFSYPELRARVTAVLKRVNRRSNLGRIRAGDLEIDPASRDVFIKGQQVELSQREFSLLRTLASEPTKVFTKQELLRTVWGFRSVGATRTLDSHACRLRRKLGVLGHRFVINVWGVGYRLIDSPGSASFTEKEAA